MELDGLRPVRERRDNTLSLISLNKEKAAQPELTIIPAYQVSFSVGDKT